MLNSKITKAVRLALIYGAASATAFAVNAEEAEEKIEKIEVTGSSIKGTDLAGALPVNIISSEDIKATGVTSVPDLITQIPSMQGFTTPVSSVGGGGAGTATASLRGLGSEYTLVLLNGRRIASQFSGSSVDINSIPLAAVERVEVLTDGASAIYGSDAIAGVINFILKDEVEMSTISARTDRPRSGGETTNISFTTGFGDYDADGFSLLFTVSHDTQEMLRSKDRDFAKTGLLEFAHEGQSYFSINGSPNAIPANVEVEFGEGEDTYSFNPYLSTNGNCAADNAKDPSSDQCMFDYTSTLEIVPESERTSFMVHGNFDLSEDIKAFATASYTDFSMTSRIAPNPTGGIPIGTTGEAYTKYVAPHLSEDQKARATEVYASWRALPGGNRTSTYDTATFNTSFGLEGVLFGNIDFSTALAISGAERDETFSDGHFYANWVGDIANGTIDVFALPGEMSDAGLAALEASKWRHLNQTWKTSSIAWDFRASQPLFELPAGEVYIGYGVDYRVNTYENIPSAENAKDERWGAGGDPIFDLERTTYGAFTEFQVPLLEDLMLSAAVRYDMIGGVDNNHYIDENDASETVQQITANDDESDVTYKLSLRYNATDDLVLRGSIGTGFRSATMLEIAQPQNYGGVTRAPYTCPVSDARKSGCSTAPIQYNLFNSGNANLEPETSDQWSLGFVYAPSNAFTFEMDYWKVDIKNRVDEPSEVYAFTTNPALYDEQFVLAPDPNNASRQRLYFISQPLNIGESINEGIDWKINLSNDFSFGTLKTSLQGTYFVKQEYTLAGTADEWRSSLGQYGADEEVVFRNVITAQTVLTTGDFSHTLRANYRSGWHDAETNVQYGTIENPDYVRNDDGTVTGAVHSRDVQLEVPSHTTFNYKVDYYGFENTVITAGVKNLFDKEPPFSLGDAEGHLVGYEGRYYDQFLRTFYLSVDYSF
jgi:iron complex outermembrane receptor protein